MILSVPASSLLCYCFVGRIICQWRRPNSLMRNLSDSVSFCLHLSRLIKILLLHYFSKYCQLLTFMKQFIVNKLSVKEFLKDVSIDGWRSTRVRWRPSTMRNTRRRLFWWRRCCRATIGAFFNTLRKKYVKYNTNILCETNPHLASTSLCTHQDILFLYRPFYWIFLVCFDLMRLLQLLGLVVTVVSGLFFGLKAFMTVQQIHKLFFQSIMNRAVTKYWIHYCKNLKLLYSTHEKCNRYGLGIDNAMNRYRYRFVLLPPKQLHAKQQIVHTRFI